MSRYSNTKKKRTKRKLRKKQKGGMDHKLVNTINLFFNHHREFFDDYLKIKSGSTINKSEKEQSEILKKLIVDIRRAPQNSRWRSLPQIKIAGWVADLTHYERTRQLDQKPPPRPGEIGWKDHIRLIAKTIQPQSGEIEVDELKRTIARLLKKNEKQQGQLAGYFEKDEEINTVRLRLERVKGEKENIKQQLEIEKKKKDCESILKDKIDFAVRSVEDEKESIKRQLEIEKKSKKVTELTNEKEKKYEIERLKQELETQKGLAEDLKTKMDELITNQGKLNKKDKVDSKIMKQYNEMLPKFHEMVDDRYTVLLDKPMGDLINSESFKILDLDKKQAAIESLKLDVKADLDKSMVEGLLNKQMTLTREAESRDMKRCETFKSLRTAGDYDGVPLKSMLNIIGLSDKEIENYIKYIEEGKPDPLDPRLQNAIKKINKKLDPKTNSKLDSSCDKYIFVIEKKILEEKIKKDQVIEGKYKELLKKNKEDIQSEREELRKSYRRPGSPEVKLMGAREYESNVGEYFDEMVEIGIDPNMTDEKSREASREWIRNKIYFDKRPDLIHGMKREKEKKKLGRRGLTRLLTPPDIRLDAVGEEVYSKKWEADYRKKKYTDDQRLLELRRNTGKQPRQRVEPWTRKRTQKARKGAGRGGGGVIPFSKKEKGKSKYKTQTGGFACLACIPPLLSGLGVLGAGTAAAVGVKNYSSSSSSVIKNGKLERKDEYIMSSNENGKKKKNKFTIKQKNKEITYKKGKDKQKTKKFKSVEKAVKYYNKLKKQCKDKKYKKC